MCPESAFKAPASLEVLQKKSWADNRPLSQRKAKVLESAKYVDDIKEEKDRKYLLVRSEELGPNNIHFVGVYYNRMVYPLCAYCKKIMWAGLKSSAAHSCRFAPQGSMKHRDLTDNCPEVFRDQQKEHWVNFEDAVFYGEKLIP